jgi:hypothetical protein
MSEDFLDEALGGPHSPASGSSWCDEASAGTISGTAAHRPNTPIIRKVQHRILPPRNSDQSGDATVSDWDHAINADSF